MGAPTTPPARATPRNPHGDEDEAPAALQFGNWRVVGRRGPYRTHVTRAHFLQIVALLGGGAVLFGLLGSTPVATFLAIAVVLNTFALLRLSKQPHQRREDEGTGDDVQRQDRVLRGEPGDGQGAQAQHESRQQRITGSTHLNDQTDEAQPAVSTIRKTPPGAFPSRVVHAMPVALAWLVAWLAIVVSTFVHEHRLARSIPAAPAAPTEAAA